jgi:hypothetical protein
MFYFTVVARIFAAGQGCLRGFKCGCLTWIGRPGRQMLLYSLALYFAVGIVAGAAFTVWLLIGAVVAIFVEVAAVAMFFGSSGILDFAAAVAALQVGYFVALVGQVLFDRTNLDPLSARR